ncbi:MAG: hypothetical protein LBS25_07230 [Candidatus Symbiothrix sp.]|jgi:putative transposase|nr:hypothetical protein [Candidatus Symbiothrix sp.]
MRKIKKLALPAIQRRQLEKGYRNGSPHCFRMPCRAVLLKAAGLSSVKAGEQTEMSLVSVKMDKNEQKNQYLCKKNEYGKAT